MTSSHPELARWLEAARTGSPEALGRALDACRAYLLTIARSELPADLQAKGGASDLVQETFLEAQRDFARFAGVSEEELLAWLRMILRNNVANFTRHFRTDKREVARERTLEGGHSSAEQNGQLVAQEASPSGHAASREQAEVVQRALERLPEDYRAVLRLRYQEGRSFDEIGADMGRTGNAIRKLWLRALEQLKLDLKKPS